MVVIKIVPGLEVRSGRAGTAARPSPPGSSDCPAVTAGLKRLPGRHRRAQAAARPSPPGSSGCPGQHRRTRPLGRRNSWTQRAGTVRMPGTWTLHRPRQPHHPRPTRTSPALNPDRHGNATAPNPDRAEKATAPKMRRPSNIISRIRRSAPRDQKLPVLNTMSCSLFSSGWATQPQMPRQYYPQVP
jgi:hypothetical protein